MRCKAFAWERAATYSAWHQAQRRRRWGRGRGRGRGRRRRRHFFLEVMNCRSCPPRCWFRSRICRRCRLRSRSCTFGFSADAKVLLQEPTIDFLIAIAAGYWQCSLPFLASRDMKPKWIRKEKLAAMFASNRAAIRMHFVKSSATKSYKYYLITSQFLDLTTVSLLIFYTIFSTRVGWRLHTIPSLWKTRSKVQKKRSKTNKQRRYCSHSARHKKVTSQGTHNYLSTKCKKNTFSNIFWN